MINNFSLIKKRLLARQIRISSMVFLLILFCAGSGFTSETVFQVAGVSMEPALMAGDTIVVDDNFFENNTPQQRDMVAISLKNRKNPMVKRIVGTPGDTVTFHDDILRVNEQAIRKINPMKWKTTIKQMKHYRGIIPARTFLILGDNPRNSRDSRKLGLISADQLIGKVVLVTRQDADR